MLVHCLLAAVLAFQACLATPIGLKPRITDGKEATPGEFPYQVSIQLGFPPFVPFTHVCGGSILAERFVLTAGHCVMPFGKLRIMAGKHLINQDEPTQQEVDVEKAIVHKDYAGGIAQHDIAILRLEKPLVFNDRVSQVDLPKQDEVRTGQGYLSGWGSTSKEWLPKLPVALQYVLVPLLDNESCQKKFSEKNIIGPKPKLYDTQICTDSNGEVSACSGDSGGPLIQHNHPKTMDEKLPPIQIGIVSWGVYPCGIGRTPSVYTRVSSYVDWINSIMS